MGDLCNPSRWRREKVTGIIGQPALKSLKALAVSWGQVVSSNLTPQDFNEALRQSTVQITRAIEGAVNFYLVQLLLTHHVILSQIKTQIRNLDFESFTELNTETRSRTVWLP